MIALNRVELWESHVSAPSTGAAPITDAPAAAPAASLPTVQASLDGAAASAESVPTATLTMSQLDAWIQHKRAGGPRPEGPMPTAAAVAALRASVGGAAQAATVLPHPIRSGGGGAQGQRPLQSEDESVIFTPGQWAIFFICTLHVAFSLLRSIYTRSGSHGRRIASPARSSACPQGWVLNHGDSLSDFVSFDRKNGRYNWGYVF